MANSQKVNIITSENNEKLNLNNTLRIEKTNTDGNNHSTSAIFLKDQSSSTGSDDDFKKIFVKTTDSVTDLFFNTDTNTIISSDNAETEIEKIFNTDNKTLTISNLILTGGSESDPNAYINFANGSNTSEGEDGIGIKMLNNGTIQFKNIGGSWGSLSGGSGGSISSLSDTTISSLSNNQLLVYNSSSSKWINSSDITIPGLLTLSSNIQFSNKKGILDSNQSNIVTFIGNSSSNYTSNHIQIENQDPETGNEPKITASGTDNNIGIDIVSKGSGNITMESSSGSIVLNSSDLDIYGYIKSSIYKSSSNSSYVPNTNWSVPISSDTLLFDFIESNTAGTYLANIVSGQDGQKLNIIFNNSGSKDIDLLVDFREDNLLSGSGLSRKLNFKSSGESASLVYLSGNLNKWQIINTGCAVI
tara:strand:+ start:865 stop:2115 length:1251 start_codon:yes stop_codon:yes gene_type:complete